MQIHLLSQIFVYIIRIFTELCRLKLQSRVIMTQCGQVPVAVDMCQSLWTSASRCGHVPVAVDMCQSRWTCASRCGQVPVAVDMCQCQWSNHFVC